MIGWPFKCLTIRSRIYYIFQHIRKKYKKMPTNKFALWKTTYSSAAFCNINPVPFTWAIPRQNLKRFHNKAAVHRTLNVTYAILKAVDKDLCQIKAPTLVLLYSADFTDPTVNCF